MASDAPAWTVIGQREDFGADGQGNYVLGVSITFRTAAGDVGTVFVPQAEYTVERAKQLIGQQAATMAGVRGLEG